MVERIIEFCAKNRKLRIERMADGEIIIMPPAGGETGYRNNDLCRQLGNWARADGRGIALASNTEFILPNGAALAPDAVVPREPTAHAFAAPPAALELELSPVRVIAHHDSKLMIALPIHRVPYESESD